MTKRTRVPVHETVCRECSAAIHEAVSPIAALARLIATRAHAQHILKDLDAQLPF